MDIPQGYKQTDVGVIPEDWKMITLEEIGKWKGGGTPSKQNSKYWNGNIPWLSPKDFHGLEIAEAEDNITEQAITESSTTLIPKNSILLVTRSSILRNYIPVAKNIFTVAINQDLKALIVDETKVIDYVLQSIKHFNGNIKKSAVKVGTTVESVDFNSLKRFAIPLPPTIEEQKAIAQSLSDVDALITAIDQLITKKRNIKQGTMQQLLTGKKRLPGFSGDWEVKKLGDIVNKVVGGGTPSRNKKEYWNGNIFWATVKDFTSFCPYETEETITQEGLNLSASNLIPKGTLIISTRMAVGKVVIYNVDVAINQDLKAIYTKPDIDTKFLFYCFTSYSSNMDFLASGSTVKGIILEDLKNIEFPYISLEEQKTIAQILSDMDAEIEVLEKKREKYKTLKQGMMQELLTGKTRLKHKLDN
jgi:type I restriction enzyme, S subunit